MKFKLYAIVFGMLLSTQLMAQQVLEITLKNKNTRTSAEGVVVTLNNSQIGYSSSQISDINGKTRFTGLSTSGEYVASISGNLIYADQKSAPVSLRSNFNQSISFNLTEKASIELQSVSIEANSITKINTLNGEVSSTLTQQDLESLPIEGRDITRSLYRLPNVTQATGFYPEAPNVSINGANGLYTNYLIDGMDNNENFLGGQKFAVPVGFAKNVTVLTNTFSSEFGRTGNGVVNITSRSGSNDFGGELFFITRPGSVVDSESPFAQRDLSGNSVKDGFQRYQAGFGFGGAIKKDKTFYYLNAEQTIDLKDNLLTSPALGVNETIRGENRFTYLSGKIDHIWNPNFRSSLRVNSGLVNIERQAGGLTGGTSFLSAGNSQDRNSILIANNNIYYTENFSSETNLQFSRFRWNYGKADNINSPQVSVLGPDDASLAILGHPGFVFDNTENTEQVQQKFTFFRGKHTFKTGFDIISSDFQLAGGGNPNGNYTVKLTQDQVNQIKALNKGSDLSINDIPTNAQVLNYNVEIRPNTFGKRQNQISIYAEDQYSVTNKLNVSAGIRYDYDNLSVGGSDKGDFNNIAPRLSANYKLSDKSVLRAGYGIFYDKILYAIYSDALQQNTDTEDYKKQLQALKDKGIISADADLEKITFDGNFTASASNVTYLNGPSAASLQDQRNKAFSGERRILNPDGYQNPYTHQFSLGYQYQIGENKLFYVDLLHAQSKNLARLKDLNAPSSYKAELNNNTPRSLADADLTRPIAIENGSATINGEVLTGVARNITVTEMEGESKFYAASFNLLKDRGFDKYSYRLTYTLSQLRNNTEDINFRAEDANNFEAEWGPSINDRTHVMNALFYYYPVKNLSVNFASLIQSGQPINRIPDAAFFGGTTDLNGDGRSFGAAYVGNSDRQPGETRNNDRLPWSNSFDAGVQYSFPFSNLSRLEIRADVFNLFNVQNLSGYSNNASQSNQIQIGSRASGVIQQKNFGAPRQFQFTVRYAI